MLTQQVYSCVNSVWNLPEGPEVLKQVLPDLEILLQHSVYAPTYDSIKAFIARLQERNLGEQFYFSLVLNGSSFAGFLQGRVVGDIADLDHVAVPKEFQGRKIGLTLVEGFFDGCRQLNAKKILLEVGVENLPAFALYTKLGFVQISERKKYYRSGESALIMEKNL